MLTDILNNAEILAHCEAGEFASAAAKLNALTTSRVIDNGDFTKFDVVVTRLGQDIAGLFRVGLERALSQITALHATAYSSAPTAPETIALEAKMLFMRDWVNGLRNPGVVYSNADVIANLDSIAAGLIQAQLWSTELVSAIKSIGVSVTAKYNTNATAVETAWNNHLKQQKIDAWGQVNAHAINEILNAGGTLEQVKAYIAAWQTGE